MKIAITHDIDRITKKYQYITYSLKALKRGNYPYFLSNLQSMYNWKSEFWNFERIMEIEDRFSLKSTFFFLDEPAAYNVFDFNNWRHSFGRYRINEQRVADIITYLDLHGWEVGMHGSFNSYKNPVLLKNEKEKLEKILGKKVYGIRQHYLNLIPDFTWMKQYETGFLYDSSWGLKNGIGFRDNMVKPFMPLKNKFTVYPVTVMDYCFREEKNKWEKFESICENVRQNDAVLVLNWHNDSFSRKDFPGREEDFTECIKRGINMGGVFKRLIDFYNEQI